MPLTAMAVSKAKPKEKTYRLFDSGGLYVEVPKTGNKRWRLKYRFHGKEKRLSLGVFPDVSLAEAREKRDEARKLVAQGVDPSAERKKAKVQLQESFRALAQEWFDRQAPTWTPGYAKDVHSRLFGDAVHLLGDMPMREVTSSDALRVLKRIESRGALDLAKRVRQIISQIFRYAIATGRADNDPTYALQGALPPTKKKHFPALTDPREVGQLLRDIDEARCDYVTHMALKISPYLMLRPGELRGGQWCEVDWEAKQWRIPAERMKMRETHTVPLARQPLELLRELHALTGRGELMFPGRVQGGGPISVNTLRVVLVRMGYRGRQSAHGFRTTASTLLNELGWHADAIERQLAHSPRDSVRAAYNRAQFLADRTRMMQAWADYVDQLRAGAVVVPINGRKAAGGE